jgi:tetratricopeptide (TPR) repeat protein
VVIGNKFFVFEMERIEKLIELLKDNPLDSFLQHALALEYLKAGDEDKARKLFERILEREPSYIGSYYQLAKLFEQMGDKESAKNWYERGMKEAQKVGEVRAFNELKSAYEELVF